MFQTGNKVFIRTVTYHHVGEIDEIVDGWVRLRNASWVADSGRFHTALENGTLTETEYVGPVQINLDTIVDVFPWVHELPTTSK